ncbi:hypothetical protein UACE39S_03345 [Ureibacillus acetophenoni]
MEKIIDIEDRIPTLREKRRKRTNKKFIFLITLFFITLFLLLCTKKRKDTPNCFQKFCL